MGTDELNQILREEIAGLLSETNLGDETDFTIPALIPINSSRVIPGFLGIPEVITQISEPAVFV